MEQSCKIARRLFGNAKVTTDILIKVTTNILIQVTRNILAQVTTNMLIQVTKNILISNTTTLCLTFWILSTILPRIHLQVTVRFPALSRFYLRDANLIRPPPSVHPPVIK